MSKDKYVDLFRRDILNRNGLLDKDSVSAIIKSFESAYPHYRGRGSSYWRTYLDYIINHWHERGEHLDVVKNIIASVYNDDSSIVDVPDTGVKIKSRNETEFIERFVLPYLKSDNHKIIEVGTRRKDEFNPDIVSQKGDTMFYSEAKLNLGGHSLHTGIGQLLFYRFNNELEGQANCKYQLIFPEQYKANRHFMFDFPKYLANKIGFDMLFVKG